MFRDLWDPAGTRERYSLGDVVVGLFGAVSMFGSIGYLAYIWLFG